MDTDDDFTGPVNIGNPGEFTIPNWRKRLSLRSVDSKIVRCAAQ